MSKKSVTYRDLRNTPGQVFERLALGEPLPLVADGEAKALLVPVDDGDLDTALDAWRRGRALVALSRLQASARRGSRRAQGAPQARGSLGTHRVHRPGHERARVGDADGGRGP